jgi:outer membrane protein insertion porin family
MHYLFCRKYLYIAIGLLFIFSSCNNTRFLKDGEILYKGAKIRIHSKEKIKGKFSLSRDLQKTIYPKTNRRFLGFRNRLWFYNIAGKVNPEKKRTFRYWLKYVAGEPPVLLSSADPETQVNNLKQRLANKGFFKSDVSYSIKKKKKTADIIYSLNIEKPYTIDKITFPTENWGIAKDVRSDSIHSFLKTGNQYDLELLKKERIRIDQELKERGYFYFGPEFILFKVDTSQGNRTVNISVNVKYEIPYEASIIYNINDIFINPDFSLDIVSVIKPGDTIIVDGCKYIPGDTLFKPWTIVKAVAFKKGGTYSGKDHDLTLNRLTNLGVFKFINLRFEPVDTGLQDNLLNVHINLTPTLKKSLRLELQGVSKSNNFAGPAVSISYRNRNLRKGEELFVLSFNAAYESQFSSKTSPLHTYETGIEAQMFIPRIVAPFAFLRRTKARAPRTQFIAGATRISRVNIFDMNTFNGIYGYTWRESVFKKHEFNPFSLSYLKLNNASPIFRQLLDKNLLLRKSFEEQFIVGGTYSYTFDNQEEIEKINHFYMNGKIDLSGNMLNAIETAFQKKNVTGSLFGANYSQYSKFEADIRHYLKITKKSKLVSRFFAGVGIPYGNSESLPYIKQFFSGGTNSIRAFPARSIGPGSYQPTDNNTGFFDQPGDIKLEGNLEFRFDITTVVKGALFMDAGNVWLIEKNPAFPGGEFDPAKFMQQLAIGVGTGLRFDISYFILRFDLAFPMKTPYKETNVDLTTNAAGGTLFANKNYILNVAIGYPF